MGNESSKISEKQIIKNSQATQTTQTKIAKKSQFKTMQKQGNIKFDTTNGNLIQYGNMIIYLSQTTDDNHKSSHHIIKVNKYNLKTKQMISSIEINTSPYKIDISNCVYCINTQNNSIYLINKNTQIFTISLTDNPSMTALNFIDSENNITEKQSKSKNNATITYYNNKVIVLGAIPKVSDDQKSSDTNIEYIAYDLTKMKQSCKELAITKFGKDCLIIEIKELERLILLGGRTFYGKTDIYIPSNLIWMCSINNITNKHKWLWGPLYLPERMHSFGCVHLNLKEYRWLLLFGGTHINRKDKEAPMNSVYALYLGKTYEKLSFQELIQIGYEGTPRHKKLGRPPTGPRKKDNDLQKNDVVTDISLHGLWIKMKLILPQEANYDAFYNEHVDKDIIHLINKKNGNHYTIHVNELLQLLEKSKLFRKDGGTAQKCQKWTHY
eukprot:168601_1